jgi:hypothetical protein
MKKDFNRYLPLFIALGIAFGVAFGTPLSIVKHNFTFLPIFIGGGIALSSLMFALIKKAKSSKNSK